MEGREQEGQPRKRSKKKEKAGRNGPPKGGSFFLVYAFGRDAKVRDRRLRRCFGNSEKNSGLDLFFLLVLGECFQVLSFFVRSKPDAMESENSQR